MPVYNIPKNVVQLFENPDKSVCVEVLQPRQLIGVMSSVAVYLTKSNHTFTGQA